MFERFYRTDGTRPMRGAVLGLPMARRVSEVHGGRLSVWSRVGKGPSCQDCRPSAP